MELLLLQRWIRNIPRTNFQSVQLFKWIALSRGRSMYLVDLYWVPNLIGYNLIYLCEQILEPFSKQKDFYDAPSCWWQNCVLQIITQFLWYFVRKCFSAFLRFWPIIYLAIKRLFSSYEYRTLGMCHPVVPYSVYTERPLSKLVWPHTSIAL